MNTELVWMVAIFWIGRKPMCEVSMASASQTVRTALVGLERTTIERLTLALVVAAAAVPR